jgi:hypothetical protein
VAYSQTLAAVGGYGNYSWALVEGSLPSGLTLAATGVISGTPTALGSYTFIVQASSPLLNSTAVLTTTKQFTLLVVAPALLITTAATPNGLVGVAYSASLAATGGVLPYNWSVVQGSLPGGLTLGGNGALSGTPTAAGTFTFVAQVQDAQPVSATRTFSIIILAAVKIATTSSLPSGTVGSTYSQQLTATGGTPPYTWTASNGSLPPGLNVDPSSGLLWGTPTGAGTFSFAVTATDQGGNSDTATFTLTVVPALAITTAAALPNGTAGAPYAAQLAATGGTPPYTWIVLAELGALPSGVTVDASTGRLSGTPATGGSYSFSVRVTDSAKVTATKAFTLTVTDALTILTKSPLTSGTAGSAYQQQLSATGGRPPYTWSVSAGALPAGLALNASTGMVAGTPTAGGTFDVTIAVSDSLQTVTAPYQLTIGVPAAPTLAITGLPDTGTPATQPTLSIALSDKYPLDITGQATMTFTPDSGGDDPAVQFTTGGRTASFRVPVGTMQAAFSSSTIGVQTGTVAGTITVTARILAAGADITPTPAPTRIIRIAKSSPVIISASLSRTSSGFDLVVTGYSTPREVVSAAVGLKARPDAALSASQFTIALSGVFNTWYQSAASAPYGSQFSLRIPFTVQNVSDAVASVTVFLTNSQGGSAEKSVSF